MTFEHFSCGCFWVVAVQAWEVSNCFWADFELRDSSREGSLTFLTQPLTRVGQENVYGFSRVLSKERAITAVPQRCMVAMPHGGKNMLQNVRNGDPDTRMLDFVQQRST